MSDNEENVQADHVGGSLSLSTSPHRRSLEALGLLHNPGVVDDHWSMSYIVVLYLICKIFLIIIEAFVR